MSEKLRILELEDNPKDATLIDSFLKEGGIKYSKELVKSKRSFNAALEEGNFDLIISDFSLPEITGREAMIIAQQKAPDTPFIFVSGITGEDAAIQALTEGATDYVLKSKLSRIVPAVKRAIKESDEERKLRLAEKMREMALEDLRESEARFRGLLESAPDAVVIVSGKDKITFVNTGTEKIFGYNRGELIGQPLSTLVPDRFKQNHESHLKDFTLHPHTRALSSGLGLFGRRKDGTEFPADIMLSPLTTNQDVAVLAMIRDITEIRKAEEALRRSEELHRSLVDGARDAIFSMSENAIIQSLNPAFETITGWKREDWIGKSITDLIHPDDRKKAVASLQKVIQGEVVGVNDYRILKKSGEHLIGEFNTTSLLRDGKHIGLLGIARDVTAQRSLEDQLRQSQKMESIGILAGGIAHDFNNILGIITGHVSLLRKAIPSNENLTKGLDSIEKAAERAIGLVRQLLMFARKHDRVLDFVNVNDIATEIYHLISETFPKPLKISIETTDELTVVHGDRYEIYQLLLNLCVNARDAMTDHHSNNLDGGILMIRTAVVNAVTLKNRFPSAESDKYIKISVSDTGVGMNEETQKRIFEPFFTTKTEGKGTGLGLSTVHGIVQSNNGLIEVDSKEGSGTKFNIYLPLARLGNESEMPAQEDTSRVMGGRETILLVEDEPGLRAFVEDVLSTEGYNVVAAADGQRAIALFLAHKNISLVLSDIGLPIIGGIDLMETIKRMNPETKVILASGFMEEGERQKMMEKGAKAYIQKPYQRLELLRKIRAVLDEK